MKTVRVLTALGAFLFPVAAWAAVVPTSADVYLMRSPDTAGANATNQALIAKNADGGNANNNDRISLLKFNTTGLTPVTSASLSLAIFRNAVPAGFQVQLYGIPDGATNENFSDTAITFANSGFTTNSSNSDATDNNVLDANLTFLGTYTFATAIAAGATGTSPGLMTFSDAGGALTAFLNADTNNVASFLLTTPTVNGTDTVAFYSRDNTSAQPVPTLATNADAVAVPEPSAAAVVLLGGVIALTQSRRRRPPHTR